MCPDAYVRLVINLNDSKSIRELEKGLHKEVSKWYRDELCAGLELESG